MVTFGANDDLGDKTGGLLPVARYVRMSTDHQRYSTANQAAAIAEYAAQHGMVIVQTYQDEGKSGLDIGGRDALRRLLHDVEVGQFLSNTSSISSYPELGGFACQCVGVFSISGWSS